MIFLKTEDEIELMRAANQLVSRTLTEVGKLVNPGVTTKDLDKVAGEFIRDHGAIPTFYGFPNPYGAPFPANICTSINDVVVHGIPDETPLEEGDIVSIDCGALLNGFNGDSCYTFRVGNVSTEINALLKTTKEALYKGIEMAVNGRRIGDVSHAIESHCTEHGYGVVREFVGHGIGVGAARTAILHREDDGKDEVQCHQHSQADSCSHSIPVTAQHLTNPIVALGTDESHHIHGCMEGQKQDKRKARYGHYHFPSD